MNRYLITEAISLSLCLCDLTNDAIILSTAICRAAVVMIDIGFIRYKLSIHLSDVQELQSIVQISRLNAYSYKTGISSYFVCFKSCNLENNWLFIINSFECYFQETKIVKVRNNFSLRVRYFSNAMKIQLNVKIVFLI